MSSPPVLSSPSAPRVPGSRFILFTTDPFEACSTFTCVAAVDVDVDVDEDKDEGKDDTTAEVAAAEIAAAEEAAPALSSSSMAAILASVLTVKSPKVSTCSKAWRERRTSSGYR